ncbi:MAG: type I-E CRISPR-associated protein Cas7/Cse4/CasC [Pseudomonadota bacterium]
MLLKWDQNAKRDLVEDFINFHVLISHSPSCLNRDDMNMQKTAVFGGVTRVRVSSQSLKRAMRMSPYYREHLGEPSTRTRELGLLREKFVAALSERFPERLIATALEWISGKEGLAADTQADAVAPWSVEEVALVCERIRAGEKQELDADKLRKQIEKEAESLRSAFDKSVDIALSGRMATSGIMSSVDGALALAHTITTHAVEPQDIDWFTAVDDLIEGEGETGAGHLNTQQFSAGVFYRYASLNIGQLQRNLGDAPRERALEIARHLFHMLATVVPDAKQQSFAAHNLADFAIVSFADQPISLANAFETPVQRGREGGFMSPSIDNLAKYWGRMNHAYALDEHAAAFSPDGAALPDGLHPLNRLPDMETWIARGGQA